MTRGIGIGSVARAVLALATIASITLAGMVVALAAAGGERQQTSIASLQTSVQPDLDGHVTVYVPLVDWRVELLRHDAPVSIELELRGIDRSGARAGLRSSSAAARTLQDVGLDAERVIERAIRRAVLVAAVGGAIGALVAGALIAGLSRRRRWLLIGPALGMVVAGAVIVPSVLAVRDLGSDDVQVAVRGGRSHELPRVLRFAEQLLYVGDEYEQHYETALRSITNLAGLADQPRAPGEGASSILAISDLHDNVFVLDALDEFAGRDTVLATGDFVQVGARAEERTAALVARLGGGVVAVSGNHDTAEYVRSLRREGVQVLDAQETYTEVDGLAVAGYSDPLERPEGADGEHRLRVYGAEYERQWRAFVEWWGELERRPDVVMVHQHGFAHRLLEHLQEEGDERRLVIVTGHDHVPHVHAEGPHAIVDSGTVGAGGLAAVGQQLASFARLNVADGRVTSVDLISVDPIAAEATSRRTILR